MITAEQLEYCRKCTNHKFDFSTGWSCKQTGNPPQFTDQCDNYNLDPIIAQHERELILQRETLSRKVKNSTRFWNYAIDSFMSIVLLSVIVAFLGMQGFDYLAKSAGFMTFANLALQFLYYVTMEGLFGCTIGKMITGTIVVNRNNVMPSMVQIIIRTLCRFIPFEPFSFLGEGTGWHDTISKTTVIKKAKTSETGPEILDSI